MAFDPFTDEAARLNLDLNATLVGVRVLFEIIDRPLTEPEDDTRPSLTLNKARRTGTKSSIGCSLPLRAIGGSHVESCRAGWAPPRAAAPAL